MKYMLYTNCYFVRKTTHKHHKKLRILFILNERRDYDYSEYIFNIKCAVNRYYWSYYNLLL